MTTNYLVAYDIADNARRSHVSGILLDYGQRVQESVFWLEIDEELHQRMTSRLKRAMDESVDILWIVPTCRNCRKSISTFGKTRMPAVPQFYIF